MINLLGLVLYLNFLASLIHWTVYCNWNLDLTAFKSEKMLTKNWLKNDIIFLTKVLSGSM